MLTKELIINKTIEAEGGYSKAIDGDSGGETYKGIARNFFPAWPGWVIVDAYKPIKQFSIIENNTLDDMVYFFYEREFYEKCGCENIRNEICRMHMYDMFVNSGLKNSVKVLQRAINATYNVRIGIDGVMGPKTLKYLNSDDKINVLEDNVLLYRKRFYMSIAKGKKKKFLKGWINRANEITNWVKNLNKE